MEHIRQYDWCASVPETSFVKAEDIDNCVIERIIQNKFRDPLISSDSEDEAPCPAIDWNQVFKRKTITTEETNFRVFVPVMRPVPLYTKLSSIAKQEQFQCLKVICADNPKVLPKVYMPRPTNTDFRQFEEIQGKYLAEQKEFIEHAKTLWTTSHCSRALRPKPTIEMVYEAQYKMKAHEMQCFPKHYDMAAHIALSGTNDTCEIVHQKDLVKVNYKDLPKVHYPDPIEWRFSIQKPCPIPEPCSKHPCWFVLPNEKSMSVLPLTEVHRELAQFTVENGAQVIASEGALKCLLEIDQDWHLPISVCQVVNVDGETKNVMVFGSEFTTHKKFAMARTYKAYRHLAEYALVPPMEQARKLMNTQPVEEEEDSHDSLEYLNNDMSLCDMDVSSDDDEGHLFIDEDFEIKSPRRTSKEQDESETETERPKQTDTDKTANKSKNNKNDTNEKGTSKKKDEFYKCNCKDLLFVTPPPRSYTRWQIKNSTTNQNIDLIIHCSHKARDDSGEVIIEPIVEYQLDLGASRQTNSKLKSLALSLFLRKNASLITVRADSATGEVVTIDDTTRDEFTRQHGDLMPDVSKVFHNMFSQLQGLLPGNYILKHEVSHGPNVLLYSTRVQGSEQKLVLEFNYSVMAEADEAKSVRVPQELTPVLLPVHKFRKMLPCAFPPYENMLDRQPKKPPARHKTPPQAIRWPKKKQKKRGNNNNR